MGQRIKSFMAIDEIAYPQAFVARASSGLTVAEAAAAISVRKADLISWQRGTRSVPDEVVTALWGLAPARGHNRGQFKFIDLFAGIGGMRRAFESAGGSCVLTAEWNRLAVETYLANHHCHHPIVGDITQLNASDVPEHDILVAGFPCQPFSLAGVSKKNSMGRPHGFADETQGTLFFDVARIINHARPRAFLLENVRNLLSHDKGRTFEVIRRVLAEKLGYALSWRVINASSWVPQNRQRIFIVGIRDGSSFDFDDVVVPHGQPMMKSVLHRKGETEDATYAPGGIPLSKYTLSDCLWSFLQEYAAKHRKKGNGFGYSLVGPNDVARTLSARYGKDGSEILVRTPVGNPRRLTPRECARLMGFDRPEAPPMKIPVSDTQAYKQFGNSVAVPCVTAIAHAVVAHLERTSDVGLAA